MSIGHRSPRDRIKPRPRAGWLHCALLSLVFAALAAPIAAADALLFGAGEIAPGEAAPITIRAPAFAGYRSGDVELGGGVVLGRGEVARDPARAQIASEIAGADATRSLATFAGGMFILALFLTTGMRTGHRGKLLRNQLVVLGLLLVGLAAIKAAALLSPLSILVVPVAVFGLLARAAVDRSAGLTTGLVAGFAVAVLVPFDPGVIAVLVAQAVTPPVVLGSGEITRRRLLAAGVAGAAAASLAYVSYALLSWGAIPALAPGDLLTSGLVSAAAGGLLAAPLAIALLPGVQRLLGDVTRNKLVELEDFSNPLLQQIAERAPGTWQHSLAMANMAETAVNAIGGNGRLVRVGAYYHDLGKSIQPKYFIENLSPGEPSPHDSLAPEVSADVIFAHVTEGVRLARSRGLPERIIDFMHMHHGDGLLEYFWSKCQEQGNPSRLEESDFRYPGLRPQSKETAVLAITDAVEAASRTLRDADDKSIRSLVQRIVYGKLHLGQLDESGLTMSDLRLISESLQATIKHAHHGRIEYPWQREEREQREARSEAETVALRKPGDAPVPEPIDSGKITTGNIRLDSLDAPRPRWRASRPPPVLAAGSGARGPGGEASPVLETGNLAPEPSPAATAPGYTSGLDDGTRSEPPPPPAPYPGPITQVGPAPASQEPRQPPPESIPIEGDDPSIVEELPVAGEGEAGDFEETLARAEAPEPRTEPLAEWQEALERALPARRRVARSTMELLKARPDEDPPLEADEPIPAAASLSPGTLIIGPPPETHPGDRTVERELPIPAESVRPEKRRVAIPRDADDTEPSTAGFVPGPGDRGGD